MPACVQDKFTTDCLSSCPFVVLKLLTDEIPTNVDIHLLQDKLVRLLAIPLLCRLCADHESY